MPFEFDAAAKMLVAFPPVPPVIKGWNRLESRTRTVDFERALRAEVRDALWFLTRQWQFGEFRGEDAGSPVDARTVIRATPLRHYAARGKPAAPYDASVPLETRVEREAVPRDLATHLQVSRSFFGLLAADAALAPKLADLRTRYLAAYPLGAASLAGFLDAETAAVLPLAARNALDGGALLDAIAGGGHATRVGGWVDLSATERAALLQAAADLVQWWRRLYAQPEGPADDAWAPRFLEYQFACAADAPGQPQTVLGADAYTTGHLDWYAFDVDARPTARLERPDGAAPALPDLEEKPLSFLPAPVSFGGMPSHRYWEMENRKTEFADIDQNTTDIAKLLLTEFALVFGNDWCVFPYEVQVGTVCDVLGLLVTDDFGEQIFVRAAGRGIDDVWQRWAMYTLSTNRPDGQADVRLLMAPAVTKVMEGPPLEKVHFLRDEMANMVWAIERVVPIALGVGASGYDVARGAAGPPPAPPALHPTPAKVRYVLGTDVPDNWFPFIPVHVPGGQRAIQLQRARLPGDARARRGIVLNPPSPYYVNEEEVPRAGKIVTRSFQRARWLDGRTFVWVGRRAPTGKGEGSSGLAFDQVVPVVNRGA
jgi:hypothetical protein